MKLYRKIQIGFWALILFFVALTGALFISAWQEWGLLTAAVGLAIAVVFGLTMVYFLHYYGTEPTEEDPSEAM